MVKIAKIYLRILIAAVCLWQVPYFYNFMTAEQESVPFTLYSSLAKDFVSRGIVEGKTLFWRSDGEPVGRDEYDSLLPEYFARQLASDDRLPDSILSKPVNLKYLTDENISFKIKPEYVYGPKIPLYQLLESEPGRVDFEPSPDVFRITDKRIEFINKRSNQINKEKTAKFTIAFKTADFEFPALNIAGNPSVKKKYDNGYLISDSKGRLYNFKMVKGRPYIRRIDLPLGVTPEHCFVTEFSGRHHLGMFFDRKDCLYVITSDDYRILKVGIPPVDLHDSEVFIMGSVFTWTIRVKNEDSTCWYAVDSRSYKLLKKHIEKNENKAVRGLSFEKNGWIDLGWR